MATLPAFSPDLPRTGRRSIPRQRGLSLIELMISIAIGLILLAGVTALIVQQCSARTELDKASRQIENGRYATQVLREAIEHAGYYGEFSSLPAAPAAMPDACATSIANLDAGMPLHLQGFDSPATVPAPLSTCLANANHVPGTDVLVVRRADTGTTPAASAVANQVYLQTTQAAQIPPVTQTGYVIGTTATSPSVFTMLQKDGATLADLRKYHVEIYFVSPCSSPSGAGTPATCTSTDDNGRPIPTLKRLELINGAAGPAFNLLPLVEGIENLQFDYGLDTDGDGSPDSYTTGTHSAGSTAMAAADWANVMAVRINILARSNDPTPGYNDTKSYTLSGPGTLDGVAAAVSPAPTYRHHVFSEVVRAINASGRREQ
ncbi:MAG: pilus assembly protein PilW [Herminiimonas sp.]|nr:pilus assembly protein PilW [Herminiimonas sp.]